MSGIQTEHPPDLLEDLAKCVRCGSCKALCPTYEEEPLEPMGARGRIVLLRALATGQIKPSKLLNERLFSCILCGACAGTCPLGVDIQEAMYRGRALLHETDRKRKYMRSFVKYSSRWPKLAFRAAQLGQHILFPPLVRRGILPFMPELPESPLRKRDQVFSVQKKKGRVAIFTGCSINYVFPQLGESLINVLQKIGYEVILPKGEMCCGAPLRSLGMEEEAAELAGKNISVFSKLNVEAVLSLCPTCTLSIKHEYPKIIGQGLEKAVDISVFFRDKIKAMEHIGKTSFYHDPCHMKYGLGITHEPRELIRKAGLETLETGDSGCCGFGGLFCLSHKDLSKNLLLKRTDAIAYSKADTVITSCPGCVLQLNRTVTDRPVLHLIELIEEAVCFRPDNH